MSDIGLRGDIEFETLPRLVDIAADRHGERPFLIDGDTTISFRDLGRRVRRAAAALVALGVGPGENVAIWAPNMWEWVVAALGAQSVGAALVPINTRYKGAEAAYILRKSCARALFTVNGFLGNDYAEMLRQADPEFVDELVATVILRGDAPEGALDWSEFVARSADVEVAEVAARVRSVGPGDVADVLFTSGTTGNPKGAICTHSQNLRAYRDWGDIVGLAATDRYLVVAPFFHAFGYKAGWLAALMVGATVLPQPTFDVEAVLRRIGPDRISMLPGPPALYETLLARPDLGEHDLSPLRLAVTGAATIPVVLIERMRSVLGFETVITGYGLTEACGIATMCHHDDDNETIATTSGRAIPGVEVQVVGPRGAEVPRGEPGEVVVRGYNTMLAYLDEPKETDEALRAGGWLHTGDIGVVNERGYLRITDRMKDMFIVGGFNAYPAEIESTLMGREDIAHVAVVGVPDTRLGEVGRAYVVAKEAGGIDADELVAWCRERMANFKVPRAIVFVNELPRNATGKVQKFKLRDEPSRH